jgi:hypothetical protein
MLYRRGKKGTWYIGYPLPGGGDRYESTRSTNKRFAQKLEGIRYAEVAEGRFQLPRSYPPTLHVWSDQFLESIPLQPTAGERVRMVGPLESNPDLYRVNSENGNSKKQPNDA